MTETTQHCEMTSRGCEPEIPGHGRLWGGILRFALVFLALITTADLKAEDGGAIEGGAAEHPIPARREGPVEV